jgi:signal transduction histidine kinase
MRIGVKLGGASQDRGFWLVLLFLLLAVSVPTASVLWFTNQTINIQRETARRTLIEAYRSQLALVRDRLDAYWDKRRTELDLLAGSGEAQTVLARAVRTGVADAVICLNRDGSVAYPSFRIRMAADPAEQRRDWTEARALEYGANAPGAATAYGRIAEAENDSSLRARAAQAQVRCLLRAGQTQAAIRVIGEQFKNGPVAVGADLQGRLISADAHLLALHLMQPSAPGYVETARRLRDLLADYSGPLLPSSQRLFLISELRALRLGPEFENARTYNAERLAADSLAVDRARPEDGVLGASAVPSVWMMPSPGGWMIALFRSETLIAAMGRFMNEQSASPVAAFRVLPPGARGDARETIPAGRVLRGWRIALSLNEGDPFQDVLRRQATSYIWAAFLAIATLAVAGLLAGQAIRRQMRLARLKSDLVAAVSHELKTPLASMRLLVDSLLEETEPDPGKTREYLELVAGENVRLTRLIGNFLTFSRMERNRQRFDFAETRPSDVIQPALTAMRERLQSPGCNLDVDISPDLPALHADADALTTVLLNLLDNACKYTPDEKRISLRAYGANGHVVFAVKDNGIGITPRDQRRIFRRFYQVDRRLARETGGCGLGLSIVEFIVRAHGGTVDVESQPSAGSTFSVRLPSREATA